MELAAISFSGDRPDPGIEPGSPALQADVTHHIMGLSPLQSLLSHFYKQGHSPPNLQ